MSYRAAHDHDLQSTPLSPLQQGMLFEELAEAGGRGVNIEQIVIEFDRPPDPRLLERAWNRVAARHPALRSRFVLHATAEPAQEFLAEVVVPFATPAWPLRPGEDQAIALDRFLTLDRATGFNLEQAPLMRVSLLQPGSGRHFMVWTCHHLVIDGGSFEIVLAELADHLASLTRDPGSSATTAPPAPHYAEFIRWLGRRDPSISDGYWRQQLVSIPLPTPLALDRGHHSKGASPPAPARARCALDAGQSARLREFAGSLDVTLNNLIQAAWAILLHRYSGENEVVFGAVRTCRHTPLPRMDERVGLFINTLPVVARFQAGLTLRDLLHGLRENWITLRGHEHSSAAEIRNAIGQDSSGPMFETATVFDGRPLEDRLRTSAPGLPIRSLRTFHQTSLPLFLGAHCGESLSLELDFDAARFPRQAVARLAGQLLTLLKAFPDHAASPVTTVPWLPDAEKQALLDQPEPIPPAHPSYPAAFRESLERHAERIALRWEGGQCSYRQLDGRSNQFANLLLRRGIRPGDHVAVLLARTAELPVSLLGVLKTGAAYVPVDPAYPAERIARILSDSGAVCVVTDKASASALPADTSATIVSLHKDRLTISRESKQDPAVEIPPDADAYLIYTSGSTGEPKGVRITHRNLLSHNAAFLDCAGLGPDDSALQFGSISFDASAEEIYPTWLTGARLVLRPDNALESLDQFLAWAGREQLTVLNLPTAFWHELARALPDVSLPGSVRLVVIGGEEASLDAWRQWSDHVSTHVRLVNSYGPTETTITAASGLLGSPEPADVHVPIGKALANTRLYILDPEGEPVGIGMPGELHIGGLGVGPGYWKRDQLTAERFLADPFSPAPGARMYRSGDRVRWREDGQVEFLGRFDFQVKVRGFRIELGEVENALSRHPGLAGVIAGAERGIDGDLRITAHLIARPGHPPDPAQLRKWLGKRLPNYMIPAAFIVHDRFPVTPIGKIDRRNIAQSGTLLGETGHERHASRPHTETERLLESIWSSLLGRRDIPRDRSFFDLGGDSLRALRMVLEVERRLHRKLPLGVFFRASTIAGLGTLIDSLAGGGGDAPLTMATMRSGNPAANAAPLVLIHGGDGGALIFQHLDRHLKTGRSVYALESPFLTAPAHRAADIPAIARNYILQLRSASPTGPWLLGGYSFGGVVAYEMARQLADDGGEVPLVLLFDTPAPNEEFPRRNLRGRIGWYWARCHRLGMPFYQKVILLGLRFVTGLLNSSRIRLEDLYARAFRNSPGGGPGALRHLVIRDYHDRIAMAYQPDPYSGHLLLFRAENQGDKFAPTRSLGWDRHVGDRIEIVEVPGEHLTILKDPHAAALARALDKAIVSCP